MLEGSRRECSVRDGSGPPQQTAAGCESRVDDKVDSPRTLQLHVQPRVQGAKEAKRQNASTAKQPIEPAVHAGPENREYQIPPRSETFGTEPPAAVTRRDPIHPGETDHYGDTSTRPPKIKRTVPPEHTDTHPTRRQTTRLQLDPTRHSRPHTAPEAHPSDGHPLEPPPNSSRVRPNRLPTRQLHSRSSPTPPPHSAQPRRPPFRINCPDTTSRRPAPPKHPLRSHTPVRSITTPAVSSPHRASPNPRALLSRSCLDRLPSPPPRPSCLQASFPLTHYVPSPLPTATRTPVSTTFYSSHLSHPHRRSPQPSPLRALPLTRSSPHPPSPSPPASTLPRPARHPTRIAGHPNPPRNPIHRTRAHPIHRLHLPPESPAPLPLNHPAQRPTPATLHSPTQSPHRNPGSPLTNPRQSDPAPQADPSLIE